MVRPAFQFLALALASAFIHVNARPALVTIPGPAFATGTPTAVVLGVDSKGHTTYAIDEPAVYNGTNGPTSTLPLTATLVAGADHASYTFSGSGPGFEIELGFDCDLKDGNAICSDTDSNGHPETATFSAAVTDAPFVLDVVSTNASPRVAASISGVLVGSVLMAYGLL